MPDSSNNILMITASTDEAKNQLNDFVQKSTSTGKPFALAPTFPIPENVLLEGDVNGWCNENWSTEEVRYPVVRVESEGLFEVQFETYYNPPVAWMKKVSRDYPSLQFIDHYDDIDKKSSIEGQNGCLYEDGRLIKDLTEVTSDVLMDYSIGTILKPKDQEGNAYSFTIEVTGHNSALVVFEVTCNTKYREGNIHYSLTHKLLRLLIEKREKEIGDVKLTHESDGYGGYYFTLCYSTEIISPTVPELIEKSINFMQELHKQLDDVIEKYEVSLENDLKKELDLN